MFKRAMIVMGATMATLVGGAVGAMAQTADPDVTGAINTATGDLQATLLAVAAVGLGIGVVLFALRKGWKLVRGFAK